MSPGGADLPLWPLLDGLRHAVALAEPVNGSVLVENARFTAWFGAGGTLRDRLAGCDWTVAEAALAADGEFTFEAEIRCAGRSIILAVTLERRRLADTEQLIVEAHDISRQKEVEYMLDSYAQLTEQHNQELRQAKERVEKLLLNVMPRAVYEEIKDVGSTTPRRSDSAAVLMLDFVGLSDLAITLGARAVVAELNDLFSAFDRIVETFRCERIKAGGDVYMVVAGLPEADAGHAAAMARVALRMRRYVEERNASHATRWLCRIGMDTGPVIGSIVGVQKYAYDIFGPAVNLCTRLRALSEPMQITMTAAGAALLRDDFVSRPRGAAEIKGLGPVELWTLEEEIAPPDATPGQRPA